VVGIIAFGLAIYSTLTISETHNTDMDFVEWIFEIKNGQPI
jgi:hypothetical protein